MNLKFFNLNLRKQRTDFIRNRLISINVCKCSTKFYQANRKFVMADVTLQGALKLFLAILNSLVHLLENGLYTRSFLYLFVMI